VENAVANPSTTAWFWNKQNPRTAAAEIQADANTMVGQESFVGG
jgi:hypothetical protein